MLSGYDAGVAPRPTCISEGDLVTYIGECSTEYFPRTTPGRVLRVRGNRVTVQFPWGLNYPQLLNLARFEASESAVDGTCAAVDGNVELAGVSVSP